MKSEWRPGSVLVCCISVLLAQAIAPWAAAEVLVDCMGGNFAGDVLSRSFYVPEYPGKSLERVDVTFSSTTEGEYVIELTARSETYDGDVLGSSEITLTLAAGHGSPVEGHFEFPNIRTTVGSTVTFTFTLVDGPGIPVFWIGSSVEDCPVVETHSSTPPLSTERRVGIAVRILGEGSGVATETLSWGAVKGVY